MRTLTRRTLAGIPVAVAVATVTRGIAHAQTAPQDYTDPLGIGLEGWPYPAPVRCNQLPVAKLTDRGAVPEVGHIPHLEAPDVFRRAVMKFLA